MGVDSVCFFQAEDGIRDLVRSRGLGDVYMRQECSVSQGAAFTRRQAQSLCWSAYSASPFSLTVVGRCLLRREWGTAEYGLDEATRRHTFVDLSLIHLGRCLRSTRRGSRWSPYHH